jgi:hypothetical protein
MKIVNPILGCRMFGVRLAAGVDLLLGTCCMGLYLANHFTLYHPPPILLRYTTTTTTFRTRFELWRAAIFEATSQAADKGVFPIELPPIESLVRSSAESPREFLSGNCRLERAAARQSHYGGCGRVGA